MWQQIVQQEPDLFLWLGDVVYANTTNPIAMERLFRKQFLQKDYERFRKRVPVIGIWDDHDYGGNNLGKDNPIKVDSQRIFLDFLEEPIDSPRRKQRGIYVSYDYGDGDQSIKLLLLDTRYHRDLTGTGRADTLGETQWRWLEEELRTSKATIHLIASSYSVLSTQIPGAEEWSDFKWSKKRLFHLLKKHNVSGVLFLTGDRHFAAYLQEEDGGIHWHEFMSSGLTHYLYRPAISKVLQSYYGDNNSYFGTNFGMVDIHWKNSNPAVTFRVFDDQSQQQLAISLRLNAGQWTIA